MRVHLAQIHEKMILELLFIGRPWVLGQLSDEQLMKNEGVIDAYFR